MKYFNKQTIMKKTCLSLVAFTLAVVGCKDDEPEPPKVLKAQVIKNFVAPSDVYKYDRTTGRRTLIQKHEYQYFDFSKGKKVTKKDAWDIGIKGTTIITNGGINGKAGVQATTVAAIFDELKEVPANATFSTDTKEALAINKNSNFKNRWYSYAAGIITPVPGRVILLKDTESKYVKLEIKCYYKDCPQKPTPGKDNSIYTFRFVHQPDGSKKF